MLQASGYSLVLSLQLLLLTYDLFVNSFSELLRAAPVIQLVLFIIQDIAILFNIIVIFLMFFNTFVFQAGLVSLLFHKFKGTAVLTAVYLALSIALHVWVMNLRWKDSNRFVWTDGLQTLFVFQRLGKGGASSGSPWRACTLAGQPHSRRGTGTATPRTGLPPAAAGSPGAVRRQAAASWGSVLTEASPQEHLPLLLTHSGGVLLLLLQTHGRETGRPSLLPGLRVAAQGVHAGPKVTCHSDGPLLPGRGHVGSARRTSAPGPAPQDAAYRLGPVASSSREARSSLWLIQFPVQTPGHA